MAIGLAVIASVLFASGATMQHLGVERNFAAEGTESRAMTFRRLVKLLTTPLWIGGLAAIASGACLHIVGLKLAPLTVVQPVGILAVPISILLANRIFKTKTTAAMWLGVAVTVAGIVGFTILSSMATAEHAATPWHVITIAAAVVWACALALAGLALRGPRWMRSLAWAWAGAFLYGLGSAFIKVLTSSFGHWGESIHLFAFIASAIGLVVSYAVGGWMIQQAYATGPAEVVVGVMTTVDPMVAVLFGLIVLREGRHMSLPIGAGMIVAAVAAAWGVFHLSKHHPEAKQHRGEHAEGAPDHEAATGSAQG